MEFNLINPDLLNGLALAYIGDSVYEIYIRKYILSLGLSKVNTLHKNVIKYTSGEAQATIIHNYLENNILTDDEINIFKRGRNSHVNSSRKNLDLKNYLDATGFEALIGYLYLKDEITRMEELIELAIRIRSWFYG